MIPTSLGVGIQNGANLCWSVLMNVSGAESKSRFFKIFKKLKCFLFYLRQPTKYGGRFRVPLDYPCTHKLK